LRFNNNELSITKTKQPWVRLPKNAAVFNVFYDDEKTWSMENNTRRKELLTTSNDVVMLG
jgi:hypothetical protein